MNNSFWKAGHTPTLFSAFLYFDLSFMVWYLLGPLAVQIATDLDLSAQQRGIMVATPILAGALLRLLMGFLADRLSPKTAGIIGQIVVICTLLLAWQVGVGSLVGDASTLGLPAGFVLVPLSVLLCSPCIAIWCGTLSSNVCRRHRSDEGSERLVSNGLP